MCPYTTWSNTCYSASLLAGAGAWSQGSLHPPGQEDTHGAATGKALHKAKYKMKFHHLTFPDSIVDCSLGVIFEVPIGSATTLCPKCKIANKK